MPDEYQEKLQEYRSKKLLELYEIRFSGTVAHSYKRAALDYVILEKEYTEAKEKDLAIIEEAKKANRNAWISAVASIVSAASAFVAILLNH